MSNDSSTPLNTPILEDGLERIPFFNGRVLTAEDLQTEQKGNAEERRRLGRGLGTGVLEGLSVRRGSGDPPTTVVVERGLGLAPSGRVVELPQRATVSVVSEAKRAQTAGTSGQFEDCSTQNATVTSGTGAYVLVLEPASDTEGRVSRVRLGDNGRGGACGSKRRIEGGRVCLVGFNPSNFAPSDVGQVVQNRSSAVVEDRETGTDPDGSDRSLLRNILAHICLRTPSSAGEAIPLAEASRGRTEETGALGPVDELRRRGDLSEDAVPLALLYWSRNRIEFVDMWAVRRRVHRRRASAANPATDRRRAEAEAAVFQFHRHLDALRERGDQVRHEAVDEHFAYLPPLGIMGEGPTIARAQERERTFRLHETLFATTRMGRFASGGAGSPRETATGVSTLPQGEAQLPELPSFFDSLTVTGPSFVEPQRLRALIDEVLQYPPLPVNPAFPPDPRDPDEAGPLVWVYLLAPNVSQAEEETPFLFTTGYAPFFGDAQFNLSRANQSTFSSSSGPPSGS